MGDAANHPVDDAAAALDGLGVVDGEVIEGHAELPGPMKEAHDLCVSEDGLGRDAPPVEADAPQRFALDDNSSEAQLRGSNGGDVAAGAGANNGQLVLVRRDSQGLGSSQARVGDTKISGPDYTQQEAWGAMMRG